MASRFRKVAIRIWGDEKFQRLSPLQPSAQALFLFLLTNPYSIAIPGIILAGEQTLAEKLRWKPRALSRILHEILCEEMVKIDRKAQLIWLPNAIEHNMPSNGDVIKGWRDAWDEIPECLLKFEIAQRLMEIFSPKYIQQITYVVGHDVAHHVAHGVGHHVGHGVAHKEKEKENIKTPLNAPPPLSGSGNPESVCTGKRTPEVEKELPQPSREIPGTEIPDNKDPEKDSPEKTSPDSASPLHRSNLPCDNPTLAPVAKRVARFYAENVPTPHAPGSPTSIIELLQNGYSEEQLKRAAKGYGFHCQKNIPDRQHRQSCASFYSAEKGNWMNFLDFDESQENQKAMKKLNYPPPLPKREGKPICFADLRAKMNAEQQRPSDMPQITHTPSPDASGQASMGESSV